MQKIMQVHFNFLCRQDRANKKGESPVVLRIIFRRERRDTKGKDYIRSRCGAFAAWHGGADHTASPY